MKKIIITTILYFVLGFFGSNVIGQQFLWTTNPKGLFTNSPMKVISKDEVKNKLLDYYENYRYYYDYTGFTKEGFFDKFKEYIVGNDNSKWEEFKKSFSQTNELTISSIKGNLGNGSVIMILIVSKNNFDMIVFSNQVDNGLIHTSKYEIDKFIKFYKSLIVE